MQPRRQLACRSRPSQTCLYAPPWRLHPASAYRQSARSEGEHTDTGGQRHGAITRAWWPTAAQSKSMVSRHHDEFHRVFTNLNAVGIEVEKRLWYHLGRSPHLCWT